MIFWCAASGRIRSRHRFVEIRHAHFERKASMLARSVFTETVFAEVRLQVRAHQHILVERGTIPPRAPFPGLESIPPTSIARCGFRRQQLTQVLSESPESRHTGTRGNRTWILSSETSLG
jgi:hypothetical protein